MGNQRVGGLTFLAFLLASSANAQTFLRMESEEGDYIGLGQQWFYEDADGTFDASRNSYNGISVSFQNDDVWWNLDFVAPRNAELIPGPYEPARRYPFQSPTKAGLDVSGDGRGCNELTGEFVVLEVLYGAADTIERFAATFEQHCENGEPALTGEVRFNSTGHFGRPPDSDGDRIPDTLDNCPFDRNRNQRDSDFDTIGDKCDDELNNTFIFFDSPPGDYIGQGETFTLRLLDGDFTAEHTSLENHVGVDFHGDDWWSLHFAATQGAQLGPGVYEYATRYPFQEPSVPGLSVYGAGRGCNRLSGRFQVFEAVYGVGGVVERFAADFEQSCETFDPPLVGSVRVNASDEFGSLIDDDEDDVIDFVDNCPGWFNPAQRDEDGDDLGDTCDANPQATFVVFDSEPGDPIGQGERKLFTTQNRFLLRVNGTNGISFTVFTGDGFGDTYDLDFAAPNGEPFEAGAYEGATRFPFQDPDEPGLSVSGDGRGCNQLTGRFDVLELEYAPNGSVAVLSIDFEQHCEGMGPALFGSIRYHTPVIPAVDDQDGDAVLDLDDNCVDAFNPWQLDTNGDGIGAACTPCPEDAARLGSVRPRRGKPGKRVRLRVRTLQPETEVWFGSSPAEIVKRTSKHLTVLVPDMERGRVPLRITSRRGCAVDERARKFNVRR